MNRIIHYSLVLFMIAAFASGALAIVNDKTKIKIAETDKNIEIEARRSVLTAAERFEEKEAKQYMNMKYIPGYNSAGEITGYVVGIETPGYGPVIKLVAGISNEGKLTGIKITDASKETPGLGSKITDKKWQEMWKGRNIDYEFDKKVDGFAGATISPKGVYTGLKKALQGFESMKEGDK